MSAANNGKTQTRNDAALNDVFTAIASDSSWQNRSGYIGFNFRLGKIACEELYRIPICRRVCRAKPDAAILKGWELTIGAETNSKIISKYNKESQRLKIPQRFNEAQILANIYGGAAIVINVDDGQHWRQPVDINNIRKINSIRVLDRYKIAPALTGQSFNLAEPEFYQLQLGLELNDLVKKSKTKDNPSDFDRDDYIHHSRVIRFDGISLPPDMMAVEGGWGMSLLDSIWEDFRDWKSSLKSMKSMLEGFSIFTYKIAELSKLVDDYGEDTLRQRFQTFKRGIEVLGAAAIDKDNEDVSYTARQLGGVDSVADKLRDAFIGATGIPHTKLFGESPSGLGASGESEEKDWAASVNAFQQSEWHQKLQDLGRLLFFSQEGPSRGKEPDDWGLKFHSLIQESPSEVASLRSTQAQTDNTYLSAGILLPEEIRNSRFGGAEYSVETNLDQSAWEKSQKAQEQQNSNAFEGDYGQQESQQEDDSLEEPQEEGQEQDSKTDSLRCDAIDIADLEKKGKKVKYQGRWWEVGKPVKSDRTGKKMMVLAQKGNEVKLVHFGAVGYKHNYSKEAKANYLARSAGIRDKDGNLTKDDPFSPNYWARKILWPQDAPADGTAKIDSAEPIKRVLKWNGLEIGVTHDPGDVRFEGGMPMVAHYGHIRGSYGHAEDGMAHDIYLQGNADLDECGLFRVRQNQPSTGFKDEDKYVVAASPEIARSLYIYHAGRDRFGGIDPVAISELDAYRTKNLSN